MMVDPDYNRVFSMRVGVPPDKIKRKLLKPVISNYISQDEK
jgi:hypothetical protein